MKTALIIGGGEMDPLLLASIHTTRYLVLCADSGADAVWEAGIIPDVLIGDMDSISRDALDHFTRLEVRILTDGSPDHLDTELAITEAVRMGAGRIIILGAWGERIDQSMASLSFLDPSTIPLSREEKDPIQFDGEIIIVTPNAILRSVSHDSIFPTRIGTRIALLPLPHAEEVTTKGLRFDLKDEDLRYPDHWSVSNSAVKEKVEVNYREGDLALMAMFSSPDHLLGELRSILSTKEISDGERAYHQTLREIYDHGGVAPMEDSAKEVRLSLTRKLMDRVCPKHKDLNIIHIAGTSGKGSVALFLHSILSERYTTGLLISPHIHDLNERVQINMVPIPHDRIVAIWDRLRTEIARFEHETGEIVLFQEIMLIFAFTHFRERGVEWAVVETGLGGRYDQTRVLQPKITAITRIDLDHTHILGSTIPEIALEKAGIIRQEIPLFTSEQKEEVLGMFRSICEGKDAPFHPLSSPEGLCENSESIGSIFSHGGASYSIRQPGEHQAMNADLAVSIAESISGIQGADIRNGLNKAHLPGRIEIRGKLIIDTAHNPSELRMLHRTLTASLPKNSERVVVCGMADTKDHLAMIREVGNLADILILTKAGYRGEDPLRLYQLTRSLDEFTNIKGIIVEPDPMKAYRLGRSFVKERRDGDDPGSPDDDVRERGGTETIRYLIITGSTFLVDDIFNPDEELRRINSA